MAKPAVKMPTKKQVENSAADKKADAALAKKMTKKPAKKK